MTDLANILRDLAGRGARLWVEEGQLRYLAPQGVIDAVVATLLRANREEVIALLVAEGCCWSAQPATEGQRAFWFLHQLASGQDTENTLLAVLELNERVESAAVRDALTSVAQRHEVLRTGVVRQLSVIWQHARGKALEVESLELGEPSDEALEAFLEAFAAKPFNLASGDVIRACMVERPGRKPVLALAGHHVALDFGALQQLLLEVASSLRGEELPTAMSYIDWSGNERKRLESSDFQRELQAARHDLSGLAGLPRLLPTSTAARKFTTIYYRLDPQSVDAVRSAARGAAATPAAVFAGLFAAALSEVFQTECLSLNVATRLPGSAVANLANLTPLVIKLTDKQTCEEVIKQAHEQLLRAIARQHIPISALVEVFGSTGFDPREPGSPFAFAWHRWLGSNPLGEILPVSRQLGAPGAIGFTGQEDASGFAFKLTYDESRVEREIVDALARRVLERVEQLHSIEAVAPLAINALSFGSPRPTDDGLHGDVDEKLLQTLADTLSGVIKRPVVDLHSSVFDMGVDSLKVVDFKSALRDASGRDVPLEMIFESGSLHALARRLSGSTLNDLIERDLAKTVSAPQTRPSRSEAVSHVLITGATGYLGARVLRDLLGRGHLQVSCLVRSHDGQAPDLRLREALAAQGILIPPRALRRVSVLEGAVGLPKLGLDDAIYQRLADQVTTVLHAAAQVNFIAPYAALRGNALGALDIAAFCNTGRSKALHFVSTYSVLNPSEDLSAEAAPVADHQHLDFGYARSKWVAEKLLARSAQSGMPLRIYRPSRIVSTGPHERLNQKDFYSILLSGCLKAGIAPVDAGYDNFVDVTGVARALAAGVMDNPVGLEVRHLTADDWTPWSRIIDGVSAIHHPLVRRPYEDWVEEIARRAEDSSDLTSLRALLGFLRGSGNKLRTTLIDRHPVIERRRPDEHGLTATFGVETLRAHLAQLGAQVVQSPINRQSAERI